MANIDIFNSDAFSMTTMLAAIEKVPTIPRFIGEMNLFAPSPSRTADFWIEGRTGTVGLIQTSARGTPPTQRKTEARDARAFKIGRLAKGDTIQAAEIQNIRAFGSETELMQVQAEVGRRMYGPTGIMNDIELTWENMRLGAIQGILTDADGSVIYNYFTELGDTQAAEIDFDLDNPDPAGGVLRTKCSTVLRAMQRASKGAWVPGCYAAGLCGDGFFDDLVAHKEYRAAYLNRPGAEALTEEVAWREARFGGIRFINYQGTDDNSTVAVPTDKCKFFPVNAPGVFQVAWGPGETFEVANQPGRPLFPMIIPDRDRNMFVTVELYSYPLFFCSRPAMLQRAKRT